MSDDIQQELLREVRRMRRSTQFAMWWTVAVTVAGVGSLVWLRQDRQRSWQEYYRSQAQAQTSQPVPEAQATVWPAIEAALDGGDNQKALSLAQNYVARQPGYHYSHATLGSVYVATGDYPNAETAYLRAIELYPIEDHEKALAAIRKRLARERTPPAEAR